MSGEMFSGSIETPDSIKLRSQSSPLSRRERVRVRVRFMEGEIEDR
jgi:hypothetical protein